LINGFFSFLEERKVTMRITREKNMAFADQPEPIQAKEVAQRIQSRKALKRLGPAQLDIRLLGVFQDQPKIEYGKDELGNPVLRLDNFRVGEMKLPPDIETKGFETLGNKSDKFNQALVTQGYLPDHLDLRPIPKKLPRKLQTAQLLRAYPMEERGKFGYRATTIFPPDQRYIFYDTSYPWCTCGRVDTPLGYGSGVMVGPRHLLTVSHLIQWNANNTAGWVQFRPHYYAPSAPFGDCWGIRVYYKYKVVGPTVDWIEGMYDYVIVVLDRRKGDWTGWMGSRGYTDAWDGSAYWSHIGYPGDLTSGNRPIFQGSISLDGLWWEFDSHETMEHHGDVWPGQSGGPYFGWWDDGPYAVATQSGQNSDENTASGGQDLVDLVLRARADYP